MTGGTPNDYLNPYTSSMKMIAWNYQGVGSVTEARAQAVINILPYNHSQRVDPTGFSRGIWLLWNERPSFKVEILTHSDYSIHAVVKVPSPSLSFLLTAVYALPNFNKRKIF